MPLWIPPSARESVASKRIYRCNACGTEFPEYQKQAWIQHVGKCARTETASEAHAAQRDDNAYTGVYDTEKYAHLRKGGT